MNIFPDKLVNKCPVLPVKIVPEFNESSYGIVMRIASACGYPSPRWIGDLTPLLKRHSNFLNNRIANVLIKLMDLDESEAKVIKMAALRRKQISSGNYSYKVRLCPECIKKNGYLDYMWETTFASACPYHGIQLIDSCSECSSKLNWDRTYIELCKCGADLTQIQPVLADKQLLYYNSKMWAAMGHRVPKIILPAVKDNLLNKLDLNSLCDLYRFLFRFGFCKEGYAYEKPKQVSDVVDQLKIVHMMLAEWPIGLYRFLDSLRNDDGTFNGEGLQQSFGLFYKQLYRFDGFLFIKHAFEAYIHSNWAGVVDSKYKQISSKPCTYGLIGSAVKKTHTSRLRINKLIDLGIVEGDRRLRPSGRYYTLLKQCEIKRFAKIVKYTINKSEVCRMLGITKREFDVLVSYKMIKPFVKARDRGFAEWWCDSRQIKQLLYKIHERVPKQKPSENAIPFNRICQAYLTNINLLPALLVSILSGQTQVAGMILNDNVGEFRLSNLHFDPDEIVRFRQNYKNKHSFVYSIPETAIKMGYKQEVVYHLVNAGFLNFSEDHSGLKRGRVISIDSILEFEKKYVSLVEVAHSQNHCPRTILLDYKRLGISPAIGGGTDSCRQVFYRRTDLQSRKICMC